MDYNQTKLFDPYYSIQLSIYYLHFLQYGYGFYHEGYHDWHQTLTAYNRGISGFNAWKKKTGKNKSAYSIKILKFSNTEKKL